MGLRRLHAASIASISFSSARGGSRLTRHTGFPVYELCGGIFFEVRRKISQFSHKAGMLHKGEVMDISVKDISIDPFQDLVMILDICGRYGNATFT